MTTTVQVEPTETRQDGEKPGHIVSRLLDDGRFVALCGSIVRKRIPLGSPGFPGCGMYCFVCEDTYVHLPRAEQDRCWEVLGLRNPNQ